MQTYEEEGLGVNQVAKMHATGTPQGQTTVSCLLLPHCYTLSWFVYPSSAVLTYQLLLAAVAAQLTATQSVPNSVD